MNLFFWAPLVRGLLFFSLFSCAMAENYPLSDHYDGKIFFNPQKNQLVSLWEILKWKMNGSSVLWPDEVMNKNYSLPKVAGDQRAVVTFINHATFMIQMPKLSILTDPIFSQRASPLSFMGPKRVRRPGLKMDDLPVIDVVLISHNHYDHLDLPTLKILDAKFHPLFLVPLGDAKLLKEFGLQNVREMDWWEELIIKGNKIIFTPAQHWSARGAFDKCKSLWGSYFIQSNNFKTYFAGDTGYSSHFLQIRSRLGAPDLALLPIGAYLPADLMQINHMNPAEAVIAHQDLASEVSFGMHFGTFPLTDEGMNEPVDLLKKVAPANFSVLDHGESRVFN
jgi:L-ascorbate metabolism protein UlaG (beta-lactamase superfamily)